VAGACGRELRRTGEPHLVDERRKVAGANTASPGADLAAAIPRRTKYLLPGHSLARHMLDAYDAWLDEVDRELA
jgi:hypothetical protein